jgi:CDP-paratose 2-epimerase
VAKILVTGGAGFIGSNLTDRLLREGHEVTILDNLSRHGCEANVKWLHDTHRLNAFRFIRANLNDFDTLQQAVIGAQRIYHLAGQTAVTRSVQNPRQDFEDNALGTLNVLEAARLFGNDPVFIYSSTNKVYGRLENVDVIEDETRYRFSDLPYGVSETQPLDFISPYGCSKGAGDQYTHDYFYIYGLKTIVMRQSCIYGYRQLGIEDQGWLAWFIIAALTGHPITIYGSGKQVRDILFIDDLLEAYDAAVRNIELSAGQAYNIGGGAENTISIWAEFGTLLEKLHGSPVPVSCKEKRAGDQVVYVSDIRKAEHELGWRPRVTMHNGITRLYKWIHENKALFDRMWNE